jgi:glycosyltransferase involved in cell wall biosynthesis
MVTMPQAKGPCVLIIGPTPPPYNGMSIATELVLKAMGDEIAFVHLDTADRRGLANIGRFEAGNIFLALYHGLKYFWILLVKRPRVVYVPVAQAWLPFLRDCLFLIPARLLGKACVVHLHGGYFGTFFREAPPLMRRIIRFALGNASLAIVLGKNVAGTFDGILPAERVRVVPNGLPDYFESCVAGEERDHRPPVLLFLSTLMVEKGALDVLVAMARVRERVGNFHTIFAGEWYSQRDKQAAEQLVEKFRLGPNVEFVGPVGPTRKHELLLSSDVFVFPSRNEGHPYVILEAMAAGLPVISTDVACIPETVHDGVHGFLVKPRDINALAERIERLLRDESLRKQMGRAARQRFLEEYTHEKFAERMRTIFAEALHEQ